MKTIYFVTSLPRTGTSSLCRMAQICGLKPLHVLHPISFYDAVHNHEYDFFADTPFYSPEFLIGILEYDLRHTFNIKFIYSHKEYESHQSSLNKLLAKWNPNINKQRAKIDVMDQLSFNRLSKEYILDHYSYIKQICSFYKIDILDYSFDELWGPFCKFIDRPIPKCKLPHTNRL